MGIEDCDVFLSFRSEVRNNFTCYLYEQLKRQGFQPFMDIENINIGDEIHGIIKKAIKYSKSAIIVFSENYASSKHCLTELVHILERNRTSKYFIVLVFYHVKAADVKYQSGKFGASFEHVKKQNSDEIVEEWRAALAEAGDILAKEISENDRRTESKIIADIVASFKEKFTELYQTVVQISDSNTIPQQNLNQNMPKTKSYRFDIEEASIEVLENSVNPNSIGKDENTVFGTWIKDWMINNPKFVIITVLIVTVIIIYTIVTLIEIRIASSSIESFTSFLKTSPNNMDSKTRQHSLYFAFAPTTNENDRKEIEAAAEKLLEEYWTSKDT